MKILHLSLLTPDPAARSGAGVVISGQMRALREAHDLTLVVLAPSSKAEAKRQQQLRDEGIDLHVLRGGVPSAVIGLKRAVQDAIGKRRGWPAMGPSRGLDPALPKLLNALIDAGDFDLLQIENLGLAGMPTDRTIPKLLIEHEVREHGFDPAKGEDPQAALWAQADRVQVFTERDAEAIRGRAPQLSDRIRVNPFGIGVPRLGGSALHAGARKPTLVFVGNFRHTPNIDAGRWLCNDIVPLIASSVRGLKVKLVGKDPPPAVRGLASEVIEVIGAVPAVEPLLDEAALVAVPVRKGGGMRVKTLQAMAAGRPVVSTRLGAEGLVGHANNWPIRLADDAQGFADAVMELLDRPDEAEELGIAARAFVQQHHTWPAYYARIEQTYRELVDTGRGAVA